MKIDVLSQNVIFSSALSCGLCPSAKSALRTTVTNTLNWPDALIEHIVVSVEVG